MLLAEVRRAAVGRRPSARALGALRRQVNQRSAELSRAVEQDVEGDRARIDTHTHGVARLHVGQPPHQLATWGQVTPGKNCLTSVAILSTAAGWEG